MTEQALPLNERSNKTLWILLGSFLLPAILAYGYFFLGDRPDIASNGSLISPVIDIETLGIRDDEGLVLSREALTPKWRMMFFAAASCNEVCQQQLFNMRQINIALGKNQDRVQHAVIHFEKADSGFQTLLSAEYENTIQLYTDKDKLLIQSQAEADAPFAVDMSDKSFIYLMDPLGNIMMRFPADLNPKLILKDIKKLLKISRIG